MTAPRGRWFRFSLRTLFVIVIALSGCRQQIDPDTMQVTKVPEVHGLSKSQVIEKLGDPESSLSFPMSEAHGEMRVEEGIVSDSEMIDEPERHEAHERWRRAMHDYHLTLADHYAKAVWMPIR